ncbi:PucR family transcriptional regulator [Microbacterium sp. NPDC089696]|uniref:PucR family transcriptional regulator n=1 Tax=Microbacterium sp. NPDC089696 TaxID=3364199 RepID=UPI00381D742A
MTGSWVNELRPTQPRETLTPTCLPETWNRTVAAIGIEPAFWAVELSQRHAIAAVRPDVPDAQRAEAARRIQPATESVNMRSLIALAEGLPAPTTTTPEMTRQMAAAVRRGTPLKDVLAMAHASHAQFGDALIEQFQQLVAPADQAQGMSELTRFLMDHVGAFSLACNAAYTAEEQAWFTSLDGTRAEIVAQVLRGATPDRDPTGALRYQLPSREHLGVILFDETRHTDSTARLSRIAAEIMARVGASGTLVIPADDHIVWAWGQSHGRRLDVRAHGPGAAGVLIAIGHPANGTEGFRRTHQDAASAAGIVLASTSAGPGHRVVVYDDLRLAVPLMADPAAAERFMRDELGPLGGESEATLRETVRVYLECNGSPARAAEKLHVAKNTVIYRVQRAEELLGRSVKDDQNVLWAALHLANVVGLGVVRSDLDITGSAES